MKKNDIIRKKMAKYSETAHSNRDKFLVFHDFLLNLKVLVVIFEPFIFMYG